MVFIFYFFSFNWNLHTACISIYSLYFPSLFLSDDTVATELNTIVQTESVDVNQAANIYFARDTR